MNDDDRLDDWDEEVSDESGCAQALIVWACTFGTMAILGYLLS